MTELDQTTPKLLITEGDELSPPVTPSGQPIPEEDWERMQAQAGIQTQTETTEGQPEPDVQQQPEEQPQEVPAEQPTTEEQPQEAPAEQPPPAEQPGVQEEGELATDPTTESEGR